MSAPISIANDTPHSPSSSASLSPQTPFFPTPALGSSATPNHQPGSLFKWASSFGKSPPPAQFMNGSFSSREGIGKELGGVGIQEHDAEHNDLFEFGDFNDTGNSGSWVKGRRAMSMSAPYGGQSGVGAMLKNNGYANEQREGPFDAEKNSKGQGVLRRLSIGGYRAPFISPPAQNTHLPPAEVPASSNLPPPPASTPSGAEGPSEIKRSAALGGSTHARGRRFSESQGGRKKGVSPMGERILREHGHF
ncbi:hypothetical protein IAR50_004554 [Cryptococcus sp. DSM 104548]